MKKLVTVLVAVLMVFSLVPAAMAAQQVEVKTNSEGVTALPTACEKAGNITFIFDAGTVITDGDWWTADLPIGVTLCHSIDFAIVGTAGLPVPGGGAPTGGEFVTIAQPDGTTTNNGIWSVKDLGTNALPGGITVTPTAPATGMFFRVVGIQNSNRLFIGAYDDEDTTTWSATANANGNTTLAVLADTEFSIKLFDGLPYDGVTPATFVWAYNDTDGDGIYGEDGVADLLQAVNDWDNSYCINVDTAQFSLGTVNVSINSGGQSGSNFLTFNPSNPQVAHLISAEAIALALCKGDEFGFVSLEGAQNATCLFDYDTGPQGYCADTPPASFTTTVVNGNRVIIQKLVGTFFNNLDQFRMTLRISGQGAYFADTGPANIDGFIPANATSCDVVPAPDGQPALTWTSATETGTAFTTYATGVGCGVIAAGQQVTSLRSTAFTGIDTFNRLVVNVPQVVYDPAMVSAGGQVTLTVELERLPCGLIFQGTRILAEFVQTCAAAAPVTTLYYPYSVELNGSSGWWYGLSIGNPTATAGTAAITVAEADGDVGTYTTPVIPAFGLWVSSGADLLSNLTPNPANTGTLGDSRTHIVVICNFGSAGGFGMMGNGLDSTGYTAYGNSAAWNY